MLADSRTQLSEVACLILQQFVSVVDPSGQQKAECAQWRGISRRIQNH